jgi:hypothetical protein
MVQAHTAALAGVLALDTASSSLSGAAAVTAANALAQFL